MASYCPYCGTPAPEEGRFCMSCGRERPPVPDPPAAPPAPQAPPAPTGPPTGQVPTAKVPPAPPGAPPSPTPPVPVPPPPAPGQALGEPELIASSAPPPPPAAQVPPAAPGFTAHPPGHVLPPPPAPPSGAGSFLRRAFGGDWGGAFQAAVWPLVVLVAVTFALAAPTYGQDTSDPDAVGFGDRFQISLAAVLQSVGGDVTFQESRPDERSGESWPEGDDYGDDYGDAYGSDSSALGGTDGEKIEISLIPLTVTALWLLALYGGLRALRTRTRQRSALGFPPSGAAADPWASATPWTRGATAGLEAAVRVSVLVAGGVLVLALFARPSIKDFEISGALWAVPGALLLTAVLSAVVLGRDEHAGWLAARPGLLRFTQAFGTALRAMGFALGLCAVILLVVYLQRDEFEDGGSLGGDYSSYSVALLLLLNFAVSGLGFSWGAATGVEVGSGGGRERETFGLSELGDAVGGWAVAGSLTAGAVCAVFLGVLAARRHPGTADRVLAGALFLGLLLVLVAIGGYGMEQQRPVGSYGSSGATEIGTQVSDALLFGLLWVAGGILVGAVLVRMVSPPAVRSPQR
ncbi:zinc ribbon domain-containing protein [Streptomyces sp. NPDC127068]|uniref:zinc ribbon domain-containing protein n=1 Tax=Streptomyces sp. NPDC127068 TaxID=3347127 RepID=UPI00365F8B4F